MAQEHKVLQVEALTYSDTIESIVDRNFRNRPLHRAEDSGAFDVDRIVKVHSDKLIRSRQEYAISPSGLTARILWATLCFALEQDVFAIIMLKGSAGVRASRGEEEYKITVVAATPEIAAGTLARLRRDFLPVVNDEGPAFFIMTGGRRAQRAALEPKHLLDSSLLALHYGEEFAQWSEQFLGGLNEPGISILRGETGTGKTSYIRHAMCALASTHRFYFVPVDNFGLLSSESLTEFWKAEQRDHPDAAKVLVLEDAETLLADREHNARNPVSILLNLTDGLLTQYVRLHLVATLNCRQEELDKALLRPGRLKFFRDFERIPKARAARIAASAGLKLADKPDFTLAEIFASERFANNTAGAVKETGPVGFSTQ